MNDTSASAVRFEPCAKRIRAYLAGHVVVDTTRALYVWEWPHFPTYYFPTDDIQAELIELDDTADPTNLGVAALYDLAVDGSVASRAARRYVDSPLEELRGRVRLSWTAMDEWLEEDEPVYTHARDPYARIDILASSRHIQIMLDGVVVADSRHARILFETGLPPRYYLPLTDIRMDLLRRSDTTSQCPYKGTANYWSVVIGDTVHRDLVWMYRAPLPESQKVAGLASFYSESVDVYLDGVLQKRPVTGMEP
ncbi:DUF427 domain-containing protein [Hoyosella subflava]|uniref:DUF427 domain-containing protein n=1 Tax=Hoyosella subflava (strain DSM 45089 / JCM 17490 / NBRC 109087 / DQS3-9A1) TaxID=443218 RepID=F6EJ25_HOYSD|nr:DUF427 domain-containing protein [Hoyosella subflava]AEF41257.1 hypothetical protein AS9A_2810 [Hoyosella subflava DQS3-9A1]